jgi:cytochrome c oxidase subunit 2
MFLFSEAYASSVPIAATEIAAKWDNLWDFLIWMSVFFFVLVVGAMIYFAVKYRARPGLKTEYITDNHLVEATWTIIPLILLMGIFGWGYYIYNKMVSAPSDAYEVRVVGKQWSWTFLYDNGQNTVNELYVPIGRPVKLVMTSQDVLHSFFIPVFRVKSDVVPGMYTSVWFEANVPGKHQIFCTEYCGTDHSGMLAKVIVLNEDQWDAWYRGAKLENIPAGSTGDGQAIRADASQLETTRLTAAAPVRLTLAQQGHELVKSKGCISCHSVDGSPNSVGPSFKGIWGKSQEMADGSQTVVNDQYIRESIVQPNARIVKGFNPVMPTFQGLLDEAEINAVAAFIKDLK